MEAAEGERIVGSECVTQREELKELRLRKTVLKAKGVEKAAVVFER